MIHTNIETKTQTDIQILGKIDDFFSKFSIATSLHRCGVRKRHGYSVRSLIMAIFTLPFLQKDFFRGIVINDDLSFGKDAAYEVLKGGHSNWRRLLLSVGIKLYHFFDPLTDENRESVLIADDSPYDRSRSKKVELLSRVWDHSTGKFIKGFRMLTLCWSDGASCLPLDFCLLSSSDAKKRLCENQKLMDKRSVKTICQNCFDFNVRMFFMKYVQKLKSQLNLRWVFRVPLWLLGSLFLRYLLFFKTVIFLFPSFPQWVRVIKFKAHGKRSHWCYQK